MKYFLVTCHFDKELKPVSKGTSQYDTIDDAEQAFHNSLASGISKGTYGKMICIVFDSDGTTKFKRVWVAEQTDNS